MAHALWRGAINFGLLHVPVTLHTLESGRDLHFRLLHKKDFSPIGYKLENKVTQKEVKREDTLKAFELEKGDFVPLTDKDFKSANVEATQSIDIQDFIIQEEIDPLYFNKPYYLAPQKKAEKGYVLLRDTLESSRKVAIAKIVMRTKEYLCAVHARDNILVLQTLRYHDQIKSLKDLEVPNLSGKQVKVSERELKMSQQLVASMTSKWKPQKYHDQYREDLMKLIKYKASHGNKTPVIEAPKPERGASNVIDMVSLLKRSIDKAKKTQGKKNGRRTSSSRVS